MHPTSIPSLLIIKDKPSFILTTHKVNKIMLTFACLFSYSELQFKRSKIQQLIDTVKHDLIKYIMLGYYFNKKNLIIVDRIKKKV